MDDSSTLTMRICAPVSKLIPTRHYRNWLRSLAPAIQLFCITWRKWPKFKIWTYESHVNWLIFSVNGPWMPAKRAPFWLAEQMRIINLPVLERDTKHKLDNHWWSCKTSDKAPAVSKEFHKLCLDGYKGRRSLGNTGMHWIRISSNVTS